MFIPNPVQENIVPAQILPRAPIRQMFLSIMIAMYQETHTNHIAANSTVWSVIKHSSRRALNSRLLSEVVCLCSFRKHGWLTYLNQTSTIPNPTSLPLIQPPHQMMVRIYVIKIQQHTFRARISGVLKAQILLLFQVKENILRFSTCIPRLLQV